jgi:hypothetical protein
MQTLKFLELMDIVSLGARLVAQQINQGLDDSLHLQAIFRVFYTTYNSSS